MSINDDEIRSQHKLRISLFKIVRRGVIAGPFSLSCWGYGKEHRGGRLLRIRLFGDSLIRSHQPRLRPYVWYNEELSPPGECSPIPSLGDEECDTLL